MQARHQTQGIGKPLDAGAAQGCLVDDEDRGRGIGAALLAAAGHAHRQLKQLRQLEIEQFGGGRLGLRGRRGEPDGDRQHPPRAHKAKPSPCFASHSQSDSMGSGRENR